MRTAVCRQAPPSCSWACRSRARSKRRMLHGTRQLSLFRSQVLSQRLPRSMHRCTLFLTTTDDYIFITLGIAAQRLPLYSLVYTLYRSSSRVEADWQCCSNVTIAHAQHCSGRHLASSKLSSIAQPWTKVVPAWSIVSQRPSNLPLDLLLAPSRGWCQEHRTRNNLQVPPVRRHPTSYFAVLLMLQLDHIPVSPVGKADEGPSNTAHAEAAGADLRQENGVSQQPQQQLRVSAPAMPGSAAMQPSSFNWPPAKVGS